jgi:hypothetical protein
MIHVFHNKLGKGIIKEGAEDFNMETDDGPGKGSVLGKPVG